MRARLLIAVGSLMASVIAGCGSTERPPPASPTSPRAASTDSDASSTGPTSNGASAPGPTSNGASAPGPTSNGASAPGPTSARTADPSLTTEEYVARGVPAIDHVWSPNEVAQASNALVTLGKAEPNHLPRFESARSGPVFARLTGLESLDTVRDRSLPLKRRMSDALAMQKAIAEVLQVYLAALGKGGIRGGDVLEVVGAALRTADGLYVPTDEVIAKLDKNESSYAARMDGYERMKKGTYEMADGALISLSERRIYRTDELVRFIRHIDATFPGLLLHMQPSRQNETLAHIDTLIRSPETSDLAPYLQPIYAKLKPLVRASKK